MQTPPSIREQQTEERKLPLFVVLSLLTEIMQHTSVYIELKINDWAFKGSKVKILLLAKLA